MNKQKYTKYILAVLILILLNICSNYYFKRLDLTSDKKYSISSETKQLIKEIDDIVFFKIYLHGDIPIEYKQLHQEITYLLNELRAYSKYIEYEFIDPSALENEQYKRALEEQLFQQGISPIPHRSYKNNKMEEVWIFPGLTVSYKTKELGLTLIDKSLMRNPDAVIKNSIEKLESLLTNSIRNLTIKKKKIGLINGHGETTNALIESFKQLISEHYQVIDLPEIDGKLNALHNIDCIIINHPQTMFSEKDKFIIDQFIMNGGKSIWLLNGTNANMDSLTQKSEAIVLSVDDERNLNDLLFQYGVRINNDLVQDLQAAPIPVVTHYIDNKPEWAFFPWTFFPIISSEKNHLITTNINPVKTQFPSTIDTINNGIKKTILLKTTKNTKITNTPALINLESLKEEPNVSSFNDGEQNIAILLNGVFRSIFEGRIPLKIQNNKEIQFKSKTFDKNKMIIISDAYFINNQFLKGQPLPLGLDQYTGQKYGNGDFMLNCIDYLLGNEAFIKIRSKSIKLRLLNKQKIETEKKYWQLINIIMPITIVLIIGLILFTIRKRKYNY